MTDFQRKTLELDFKAFAARNFERPADCKNIEQIQFYIRELCQKIEEYQKQFDYAPDLAYTLLAQYNSKQNSLLYQDYVRSY